MATITKLTAVNAVIASLLSSTDLFVGEGEYGVLATGLNGNRPVQMVIGWLNHTEGNRHMMLEVANRKYRLVLDQPSQEDYAEYTVINAAVLAEICDRVTLPYGEGQIISKLRNQPAMLVKVWLTYNDSDHANPFHCNPAWDDINNDWIFTEPELED